MIAMSNEYRIRAYTILRGVIFPTEELWEHSTLKDAIAMGFLRPSRKKRDTLIVTAEGRKELQRLSDLEEKRVVAGVQ